MIGKSGCRKATILAILSLFEQPTGNMDSKFIWFAKVSMIFIATGDAQASKKFPELIQIEIDSWHLESKEIKRESAII